MKFPKAVLTLTAVFTATAAVAGAFLVTAIHKRSFAAALGAAASLLSAAGTAFVLEDYCRAVSFNPRAYFDMNRAIDDFFSQKSDEEIA